MTANKITGAFGRELTCTQCGHTWRARVEHRPPQCPNESCPARSYWDDPTYKPKSRKKKGRIA